MRGVVIAGLVLIVLSVVVLLNGGDFTTRKNVLKIGDLKVTADEHKDVPPWAAGLGIVAGAALIISGTRRTT